MHGSSVCSLKLIINWRSLNLGENANGTKKPMFLNLSVFSLHEGILVISDEEAMEMWHTINIGIDIEYSR